MTISPPHALPPGDSPRTTKQRNLPSPQSRVTQIISVCLLRNRLKGRNNMSGKYAKNNINEYRQGERKGCCVGKGLKERKERRGQKVRKTWGVPTYFDGPGSCYLYPVGGIFICRVSRSMYMQRRAVSRWALLSLAPPHN